MSKKMIVSIIIILTLVIMIADFRINNIGVFESYFRQMETDSLREIQQGNFNFSNFQGVETTSNGKMLIDLADREIIELKINNQMGSVVITGEERQDLEVNYKITLYSEREIEEEALKSMGIAANFNGKVLELTRERVELPADVRGVRVDYQLRAPRELLLNISNRYGELVVSGFNNDVNLSNYYEKLRVTAVDGKADLLTRYGGLSAKDIKGPVRVDTAYNNTELNNLGGELHLDSRYGSVQIKGVRGNVELDISYGNLALEEVKKDIEMVSRHTQVNLRDIKGSVEGNTQYGNFDLDGLTNSITLRGRYTNFNLDLLEELSDYQVSCQTEYGDILTNLPYEVEEDGNRRILEGQNGDREVKIRLETKRANISINK